MHHSLGSKNLPRFFLALCLLLLSACATAPVQEMSDARQAILAAEEAGAERYANKPLNNAHIYLEKAEAALSRGDYADAREKAGLAKSAAVEARELSLENTQEQVRE